MKKYLLPIAVLGVVALIAALAWVVYQPKQQAFRVTDGSSGVVEQQLTTPAEFSLEDLNPAVYLRSELAGDAVELWFESADSQLAAIAFTLQVVISQDGTRVIAGAAKPEINPGLASENWTFPISELLSEDNVVTVNIAGAHVATEPYQLTNTKVLVATIPLEFDRAKPLTLTIKAANSQIRDKQNKAHHFFDSEEVLTITP